MARMVEVSITRKNSAKPVVSELGRKLRRISEKIAALGEKLLTRCELERELARRRGGMR
jgi:hypothetical protein